MVKKTFEYKISDRFYFRNQGYFTEYVNDYDSDYDWKYERMKLPSVAELIANLDIEPKKHKKATTPTGGNTMDYGKLIATPDADAPMLKLFAPDDPAMKEALDAEAKERGEQKVKLLRSAMKSIERKASGTQDEVRYAKGELARAKREVKRLAKKRDAFTRAVAFFFDTESEVDSGTRMIPVLHMTGNMPIWKIAEERHLSDKKAKALTEVPEDYQPSEAVLKLLKEGGYIE